jgi:indole-3-glycerol phosphate synthase
VADSVSILGATGALGFGVAVRLENPDAARRAIRLVSALLIGINARYKTHAGIKITGL